MKLFLAPMEGVVDASMREVLTQVGGIDQCVTEFIRVSDVELPKHVFYRECPELLTQSKTKSGVPIFVQLLGSNPEMMAHNAMKAVQLGAIGIDLNFGCPAKKVNSHEGGAVLLKTPCRIQEIVSTVRKNIPEHIPVTAKIRLGFDDRSQCIENAIACEEAGAKWLTVHARTKTDGYKPPAYWDWIPKIKDKIKIPVIANGEIWSLQDFKRCEEVTECDQFMLGRGAIRNPMLFVEIKNNREFTLAERWEFIEENLKNFYQLSAQAISPEYAQARTKQWLKHISLAYPQAMELFTKIKVLQNPEMFQSQLPDFKSSPVSFL